VYFYIPITTNTQTSEFVPIKLIQKTVPKTAQVIRTMYTYLESYTSSHLIYTFGETSLINGSKLTFNHQWLVS